MLQESHRLLFRRGVEKCREDDEGDGISMENLLGLSGVSHGVRKMSMFSLVRSMPVGDLSD